MEHRQIIDWAVEATQELLQNKEIFKKPILEIELLKNSIVRDKEITPVIKNMKTEVI